MASSSGRSHPWWHEAVFYQIYPLSFADSDADGYGDLRGIISKLDYLSDILGVNAVWLSPFYKSPMRDWGYDISDHCDVDTLFGDLDDAKTLIEEAHRRNIRVIVDYVINHTSDQHPWFLESRSSRSNPKRDWYVWSDGRNAGLPNNWVSVFSGPAWSYDETTDQWYRHTYLPEQPDLNWRNPEVVDAMLDVARFWLDLGVDGLRVDAAHQMMKDPKSRDNPPAPHAYARKYKDMGEYDNFIHLYDFAHPDVHEAHRKIRAVLDSYNRDVVSVAEIHIFDLAEWASYYGEKLDQLNMPFNYQLMVADWDVPTLRATAEAVLSNVPTGGWTNWTLGNHDEIRLASRLPEGHERLAALLLLTLRGTPILYYGDELGMKQAEIAEDRRRDPWGLKVEKLSRDGARTPMHWTSGPNAGFTEPESEPWLPLGADHERFNVESELEDPGSMLNLYKRLLDLRRISNALKLGSFLSHPASTDEVYAYQRVSGDETKTVVLNLSRVSQMLSVGVGRVVLSTRNPTRNDQIRGEVDLAPGEGVIISHS